MSATDPEHGSEAQAYKHLFPELFYSTFIDDGVRPDGRPLGRARAVTIGLGAISTGSADGSALVKIGNTTVLAGVRMELGRPEDAAPEHGQLRLNVELAPFSCPDARSPSALAEAATILQRLTDILGPGVLDLKQLVIGNAKGACWHVLLDLYVLDCDGCTFDTALLAAVAALLDARIPAVVVTKDGRVRRQAGPSSSADEDAVAQGQRDDDARGKGDQDMEDTGDGGTVESHNLRLAAVPLSLTCCLFKQHVIVDPNNEEESVAGCLISVVMDAEGCLRAVCKAGQKQRADVMTVRRCVEASRLRYKEVTEMLRQAQQAALEAREAGQRDMAGGAAW